MASRRSQKDQARAAREAAERAAAAQRLRRNRLTIFGASVTAALIAIVVLVLISSGSATDTPGLLGKHQATRTYASINQLIGGIPQHGETLGDPGAKVTVGYYGDLQCPVCMAFTTGEEGGGVPEFIAKQVRTGHADLTYRSFCTATCADYSNGQSIFTDQQTAAYAAGEQNKFWDYEELFYHEQGQEGSGYVNTAYLDGLAEQIPGLNLGLWQRDRGSVNLASRVSSEESLGNSQGVKGTPTIFVSGPGGSRIVGSGVITYAGLMAAVSSVQ